MPSYLLEVYVSRANSLPRASEEARRVAEAGELRYVRTTFLREEETCFHVFEAPSREVVVEAARRAGLPEPRVTEAIENEDRFNHQREEVITSVKEPTTRRRAYGAGTERPASRRPATTDNSRQPGASGGERRAK